MPPGLATPDEGARRRTAFSPPPTPNGTGSCTSRQDAGLDEIFGPASWAGAWPAPGAPEDGIVTDGLINWINADRSRPFFAVMWNRSDPRPLHALRRHQAHRFFSPALIRLHHIAEDLQPYLNRRGARRTATSAASSRCSARAASQTDTLVVITATTAKHWRSAEVMATVAGPLRGKPPACRSCSGTRASSQRPAIGAGRRHVDINPTLAQILGVEPHPIGKAQACQPHHQGRVLPAADLSDYQFGLTTIATNTFTIHRTRSNACST